MMAVTATEYKINFGREDMFLNPNGKTTAKVMSPQISTVDSSGCATLLKNTPSVMDIDSF